MSITYIANRPAPDHLGDVNIRVSPSANKIKKQGRRKIIVRPLKGYLLNIAAANGINIISKIDRPALRDIFNSVICPTNAKKANATNSARPKSKPATVGIFNNEITTHCIATKAELVGIKLSFQYICK
jgi:hypothetical protein